MALPPAIRDAAVAKVERLCNERAPREIREQYRLEYTVRGKSISILERRPPRSELVGPDWTSLKVAQLRYEDPTGIFWG
jgi:hypothetical protein